MSDCKHITTRSERDAYRHGGRWFDGAAWRCPWCEDWGAAVITASAIRECDSFVDDEDGPDEEDAKAAFSRVFGRAPDDEDGNPWSRVCAAAV